MALGSMALGSIGLSADATDRADKLIAVLERIADALEAANATPPPPRWPVQYEIDDTVDPPSLKLKWPET